MPPADTHSSKASTTASAWSRLVQLTRTASNTARSESLLTSRLFSTPPARPVRIRRRKNPASRPAAATSSPQPSTQNQDDNAMSAQCHATTELPCHAQADCIDVCPCQEGDPPLPDGKCSFSCTDQQESASCSPQPPRPQKLDLHAFWAPLAKEKKTTVVERGASASKNLNRPKAKDQGRHVSAGSGERHLEDQPVPSSSGEVQLEISLLEGSDAHQSTTPVCAPITAVMDLSPRSGVETTSQHVTTQDPPLPSGPARLDARKQTRGEQEKTAPAHREHLAELIAKDDRRKHATALPVDRTGNEGMGAHEKGAASATSQTSNNMASSLQEDSQDILDRVPQPAQHPLTNTPSDDDENHTPLTTPCSSQDSPSSSSSASEANDSQTPAPASRRRKRRLTLHGDALDSRRAQPHKKRRKEAPLGKRPTVQTTLSLAIGSSAGMRECKVCDTVWNPFHPEDVKVHAKRHAGALRKQMGVA